MKAKNMINTITAALLLLLIFVSPTFAKGFSEESKSEADPKENMERTKQLVEKVEEYLRENDTYVGIIARRGAGNPETGISDTDNLDLSGMAHCGFVIRNGFGKNAGYTTFNLVRMKGAKEIRGKEYDLSELRVWSLPHFFIGAFEKDAIVFLPEKSVQLKLWNQLRANGQLEIGENKRYLKDEDGNQKMDTNGKPKYVSDQIIENGAFTFLHNPEYNLLSDYVDSSSQNCNEHLLKTYIGFRDHWNPTQKGYDLVQPGQSAVQAMRDAANKAINDNYHPRQMVLSRTKSTFAFVQNIRFGERYSKSPTFFGLKLKKEKFEVVSVDSFCDPANQSFLQWADFKVLREDYTKGTGWSINDMGKNYVKINRFTGQPNQIM